VRQLCASGVVSHEALQPADRDRLEADAESTPALTLIFLRAHAAADGRQQILFAQGLIRRSEIAFGDAPDEVWNVDVDRAAFDARSVLALDAAFGFLPGHFN
jgi:hypothetical protein